MINLADLYDDRDVTLADRPYRNFGEFRVDGFKGVFVKGMQGPQRDIEKYPGKQVHVFFEYNFFNVDTSGYNVNRTDVEWGKDWRMIRDSLIKLWGLDPTNPEDKDVYLYNLSQFTEPGKYIAYEARRTGETYVKQDTGETKHKTSLWILETYDSYEECLKAHDKWFGIENDNPDDVFGGNGGNTNGDDELKAALMPWLKIAVGKATKGDKVDRKRLQVEIAGDPALTAHFSINSPEVLQLIEETEAKADKVPF